MAVVAFATAILQKKCLNQCEWREFLAYVSFFCEYCISKLLLMSSSDMGNNQNTTTTEMKRARMILTALLVAGTACVANAQKGISMELWN